MHFRSDKKNNKNISLDESVGFDKDGNEISLINILKLPKPDFAEELHTKNNIELLKEYLHILSPREKDIIIKRYGLNEEPEITQKKIAENLKISRSYVSRIEKRALTKILREFIKNKDHPIEWSYLFTMVAIMNYYPISYYFPYTVTGHLSTLIKFT